MLKKYGSKIAMCCLLLAWQLASKPAVSQEIISNGAAKLLTRFPFEQLTGGVILVKAKLDVIPDTLNFVLDTGSGGISLDSTTAELYKIPVFPSEKTIRGIAGIRKVFFTENRTLYLPGLRVPDLRFHINDYDLLTDVHGIKIDGIIGFSFLSRFLVQIDYDTKLLSVYSPGDFKYPRGGQLFRPVIVGIPIVQSFAADRRNIPSRYYFDTGAGLNLLFSEEFVSDSTLLRPRKKRYPTVGEGLGGKALMDIVVIKQFKIGRYRFKSVPANIFKDEYNVTSYPHLAGLIGNNLMRRFNVTLNYPKSQIHLVPNTHFNDPFDYSYTGLGLAVAPEGNGVEISDVQPASPAEKAGLLVGDRLLAIDNNVSQNLQSLRNSLQSSERKIKLLIYRNNTILLKTIVSERIR